MNFWKWFGKSRYPGALSPVLENFRRAYSLDPTGCPWVSEDAANAIEIDFLKVLRFSFPVPVVGPSAKALALSFAFTAENIKSLPLALRARDKIQIDL